MKLGRTLWLIPLALLAGTFYQRASTKVRVPRFVLLFIGAALVSGFLPISPEIADGLGLLSKVLLVIALGMIGLEINRSTLSLLSWRSIAFAAGLWILVVPFALLLVTL